MQKSVKKQIAMFCGGGAVFALLLAGGYLYWLISVSSPNLGTGGRIPSLSHEVRIEQDKHGVPTLKGGSIEDIYRAQGWVTARDRLFQMDLLRRRSSGRLSEIFGKEVLELDVFHRKLGFSHVAARAASAMSEEKKRPLQAYADGVNAYLREGRLPFEIRLLGYQPDDWRVEDSLLAVLAMFVDLDFYSQYLAERALTKLYRKRPKALADFLTPITGFLDSPVLADAGLLFPSVPPVSVFDLRTEPRQPRSGGNFEPSPGGSNAWALSGRFTKSGFPILAGDPHLDLYAPNIWYRLRLEGAGLHVTGVSLPGLPGVAIGSNDDLAWSITYPSADTLDLVKLSKRDTLQDRPEEIRCKGIQARSVNVQESAFGPVVFKDDGINYAIQWTALDSFELSQLDTTGILLSRNRTDLFEALAHWKGPASNVVFATKQGDIGWVLAGNFPRRVGLDGRTSSERDEGHHWQGYIPFAHLPKAINPPEGFIVSANQRMVPVKKGLSEILQTGNNFCNTDRAYRIRQLLEGSRGQWSAATSHAIQLDLYSASAVFYRDVLKKALEEAHLKDPWIAAVFELVKDWDGRVTKETPVFPFLRKFRRTLLGNLLEPLWGVEPMEEDWIGDDRAAMSQWYFPEPALKILLERRPAHLLNPKYQTYDEAILASAVTSAKSLAGDPGKLKKLRWGDTNRTKIPHPFSLALPRFLGAFFSMPDEEVGGTFSTPNVAALLYGRFHSASMRMVVDLAEPSQSLFNQPGGQSGNFQTPHYKDQYSDWLNGVPARFQPGEAAVVDLVRP